MQHVTGATHARRRAAAFAWTFAVRCTAVPA